MLSYILIYMAMESWTLSLFMAGPKNKLGATRFVKKGVHIKLKSPRKIIAQRVLEKKVCLFADTFT